MVGDRGVNAILIVGSISGERGQRTSDLVEQGTDPDTIVDLFAATGFGFLLGIGIEGADIADDRTGRCFAPLCAAPGSAVTVSARQGSRRI
jgi:hypothetical protein